MAATPKFKNPPVVETVMGVQFPEIEGFRTAHFGLYWNTIADRYPKITDQPRLDAVRERFPPPPPTAEPRIQALTRMSVHRVWLTGSSDKELIQLQPDRFHFNWRRREKEEYPSYDTNSQRFFEEFEAFRQFCQNENELSEPAPKVCEVTYVNHIEPHPGESAIDLAGRVFSGLRWETVEAFLPTPERVSFNRSFVITHQEKAIGRLHAEASIAHRHDGSQWREFVLFNLTSRINLDPDSGLQLTNAMQLAHDWLVCGFADLTDKQIQDDRWERQR